jgi:hypothetical protein
MYKEKGIKIQYIVDQFDLFYNSNTVPEEITRYTRTWRHLTIKRALPTILLSSKNNIANPSSAKDPLMIVAESNQYVEKIIIDN